MNGEQRRRSEDEGEGERYSSYPHFFLIPKSFLERLRYVVYRRHLRDIEYAVMHNLMV